MREIAENYVSQIDVVKRTRREFYFVWIVFSLIVACGIFLIVIAPIAEANQFTVISSSIYKIGNYICHQIAERSLFVAGHPFAVCARCFGIYFGLFVGSAFYPVFRPIKKAEPLSYFWLFLAMIPMAVDWSLGFFEIWSNTHLSRFLTGLILGTICALFIIPALVEIFSLLLSRRKVKRLSI